LFQRNSATKTLTAKIVSGKLNSSWSPNYSVAGGKYNHITTTVDIIIEEATRRLLVTKISGNSRSNKEHRELE
jgi:hypothetical protein